MTRVQVGDEASSGNPTLEGRSQNGQPLNYVPTVVWNAIGVNETFVPVGSPGRIQSQTAERVSSKISGLSRKVWKVVC
jgi:hypothetical protein